jgi:Tol biopolymer transport system component
VLRGSTSFIGSIWVVDSRTGRQTKVYSSPSEHVGPPIRAFWSADGGWLLFQTDTERSASLAADGVPLWAVRASGGRPLMIEREVLVASDFVRPCGRRLVVSAGLDRYVSANKRVDLAAPPAWRARDLSADRSRSWYSAACSPNGRLVAATVTKNRAEGRFDTAERSIWLVRTDGEGRRLLIGRPGDRISDEFPRWSRDGRFLLYVEHAAQPNAAASLYLVSLRTGRRRGPIAHIGDGIGYYGYHDWGTSSAWYQP